MALTRWTEASGGLPNSGRLSGTAGDGVGILDVALPAAGWAIEFSSGNNRIYRPPSGNRFRLWVADDGIISGAATIMTVRGCESASAATNAGLVDPFPTVAKIGDTLSTWIKSSAAGTTARNFDLYVDATTVLWIPNHSSGTNIVDFNMFLDCSGAQSGDPYATLCTVRNNTVSASPGAGWAATGGITGLTSWNWCRTYDGLVKSTSGNIETPGSILGTGGFSAALAGVTTGIDKTKIVCADLGTISTSAATASSMFRRAFIPYVWLPLHSGRGTTNYRDTFTDASGNTFRIFCNGNSTGSGFFAVQETGAWSAPVG